MIDQILDFNKTGMQACRFLNNLQHEINSVNK